MNTREYYRELLEAIHAAPHVLHSDLRFEIIDEYECYTSGSVLLIGGYELHIAEYVITMPAVARPKYRYHLQTADGQLVRRWDNAAHHRDIATFPDHRHDPQGRAFPNPPMDVPGVLSAVLPLILPASLA